MNRDPSAFIDLLSAQREIHQALLDLSREKRQVIVKNDTEALDDIVQRELKCLAKLRQTEKKRLIVISEYAELHGLSEDEINMSLLIQGSDKESANKLRHIQQELSMLLSSLSVANKENQELLGSQLEYTETMINVFVGSGDPLNNYYGEDGKSGDEAQASPGFYDASV